MIRRALERILPGLALAAWCALVIAGSVEAAGDGRVVIPPHAVTYRLQVQRAVVEYWGIAGDRYVARYAGQLHQESAWRADARSPYAIGMAQFTPSTAEWLPAICPDVGEFDPWDAAQSIRAGACYMHWLHRRVRPMDGTSVDECSRWAFALRGYNGGEGWLARERRAALAAGADPDDWTAVAGFRVRAVWAHKENTGYPRRILLVLEPAYRAAGWPGREACR